MSQRYLLVCLALALLPHASAEAQELAPLPTTIPANDSHIRYVGRFAEDSTGPRCAWPASMIEIKFEGTDLQVRFNEKGKDFWQVMVDGQPGEVLELKPGPNLYSAASGLPNKEHTVQLIKRTEFYQGTTQFLGLQANEGARLLPVPVPARKLEVIGDSISCGYGNEAAGKNEHFRPATENSCLAYGAVAARALGADYVCIACSGRKLWLDNQSLLPLYDAILPVDPTCPKWDFSSWIPDVVVINLATNDFRKENPDEARWIQIYLDFVKRIRTQYPNAHIYCMVGPMLSDWPTDRKPLTTVRGYFAKIMEELKSDTKVHYFDVGPQDFVANGLGADWHPSAKTQKIVGDKLSAAIIADGLGTNPH